MIESLVEELFVPQLKLFLKSAKITSAELLNRNKGYFNEYLLRTYDKYSIINALAIPNSQFRLKDVYVAQALVKNNRFVNNEEITKIDRLPVELIKKYQRLLITDTAGMGKSTIMKRMFIDLIDNCIKDVGVPIYIELNRLNKERNIILEIQEELNSLSKEFDKDLLLAFIQKGGFIFFLDGYDEISIADRNEVTKDVQTFISKAGANNYFILTSRPDDSLASFGDFQSFKIKPLIEEEAFELLSKYDITKQKKVSEELIKELKTGKYSSINEFLENPLLVSLLFSAFHYKAEIPLKKHIFYRQVYDALYNAHKLAQGQKPHEKRSGLDIDDFNRVLRYIGYQCLIKIGVQFDKDTILKSISRAKVFCENLEFGESNFLEDITTSVPLFIKDGNEYKWAHKSLMEYFAARFIADDAKGKQDEILSRIFNSHSRYKYTNMLDIYYDIDFKGFSKNITLPLCDQFLHFRDEQMKEYINKKNTDRHEAFSQLEFTDNGLIEDRIASLFIVQWAYLWTNDSINKRDSWFYIEQHFKRKLGNNAILWESIRYDKDKYIWLAYARKDIIHIIILLRSKGLKLFKSNEVNRLPFESQISEFSHYIDNIDKLRESEICKISLMHGCRNSKQYEKINRIQSTYTTPYLLSYKLCELELSRLRNEVSQDEDDFNLLSGI